MDNLDDYKKFMSKFIDEKKNFIDSIKSIKDIRLEKIDDIISWFGHEGFTYEEDAIEYLEDKIKEYQSLKDPITLYRVIAVESEKHINDENLGNHYVLDRTDIDGDFLMSIGYESWDDEWIPYVLEVETKLSNIDAKQTLIQNLAFPNENEYYLKNPKQIKLISVSKL